MKIEFLIFSVLFLIFYRCEAKEIYFQPFENSSRALQKYFIVNENTFGWEWHTLQLSVQRQKKCQRVYLLDKEIKENLKSEAQCKGKFTSADTGFKINFSKFPKYNDMTIDSLYCTCGSNLFGWKDFYLKRLNQGKYFVLSNSKSNLIVTDYIEFIPEAEKKNQSSQKEFSLDQMESIVIPFKKTKEVLDHFITNYNKLSKDTNFASHTSYKNVCQKIYTSLKHSYKVELKDNSKSCAFANIPTADGYKIKISPDAKNNIFPTEVTYCECTTEFLENSKNKLIIDETFFYLAKLDDKKYFILVENEDFIFLNVIGYLEFKSGSSSNLKTDIFLNEVSREIKKPKKTLKEIQRHFVSVFKRPSFIGPWEKQYEQNCERFHSTFKLINLELEFNTQRYCKGDFQITKEPQIISFDQLEQNVSITNYIFCECTISVKGLDEKSVNIVKKSSFYLLEMQPGKHFKLEKNGLNVFSVSDYIEYELSSNNYKSKN